MANANEFDSFDIQFDDLEELSFEELEIQLQNEIDEGVLCVELLDEECKKIANPDKLGESVKNIIWEQFMLQFGVTAGEEFFHENADMRLDLREDAHFLKTDNFADAKMPMHNPNISEYQKRYDDWQSNFEKDINGNIVTHNTRTGKEEETLVKGARKPFDDGRPTGSKLDKTDMDHTVSAGEIIRNPRINAHMTKDEQIEFANSDANLYEMDSSLNRSKSDMSTEEWLDNANANGQKPKEIFNISEEKEQEMRQKSKDAREELEKRVKNAEQRSYQEGKQSRKAEALRVGKHAAKAVLAQLLMALLKEMVSKFVLWLKSKDKSLKSLLLYFKSAIVSFVENIKLHLVNSVDMVVTVVAEAILGPIVRTIKRVWLYLKQGFKSLKEAIKFLVSPNNINLPTEIKLLEIGKIVIAGAATAGAVGLTQLIELGLNALAGTFAVALGWLLVELPLVGSISSVISIFLGGLISGLIGAFVLYIIDKQTENIKKDYARSQIIEKGNAILQMQQELYNLKETHMENVRDDNVLNIISRHRSVDEKLSDIYASINENRPKDYVDRDKLEGSIDEIWKKLSEI